MESRFALCDASYMEKTAQTALQRFITKLIDEAPESRDYFDRLIQRQHGVTGKPLFDIQRGKSLNPSRTTLKRIADVTSQPLSLLERAADGEYVEPISSAQLPDLPDSAMDMAYVEITVVPSYAGAGGGGTGDGDIVYAKLPRRLIEEELRGKPSDFELIDVRGDSMIPDFYHGDQILYDKRDRNPVQPGPFVLWDDDGYVMKLVERSPGKPGWYRIFSANQRYSPYEVEETESTIVGRPVWFARRL